MVQVIQDFTPGTQRSQAFSKLFSQIGQGAETLQGALNEARTRNEIAKKFGEEFKNIRDPDLQRLLITEKLRAQAEQVRRTQELQAQEAKRAQEFQADQENYETYKDIFGEKAANMWLGLGTGERTGFTNALLDAKFRGLDLDELLTGMGAKSTKENVLEELERESPQQIIKKDPVPSYQLRTEGMNPKDIVNFKSQLRKDNQPIWKESVDRHASYKELDRDIKTLNNLNERGNLPEGFSKLLINPATGAPYEAVTAIKNMHPDVQQWVKVIARQATQAQSAFPGRVTNFDLMAYMRQFPSLFNTYEGRKIILDQMELVNQAHQLYEDALNKVYKTHKLGGITPEDAEDLAHQMVDPLIAQIDEKLSTLAFQGEQMIVNKGGTAPQVKRRSLEEIFGG
jgi:hypothetical protein